MLFPTETKAGQAPHPRRVLRDHRHCARHPKWQQGPRRDPV